MSGLIFYFLILNCIVFIMMIYDKWMAIKHTPRIPENTLLSLAILGGAIGAFFAMLLVRHKIRNRKFMMIVPLFSLIDLVLLFYL